MTPVMHSEDISDHDLFSTLLDKRLAACSSNVEREGIGRIADFEGKHREFIFPRES